MISKFVVLFVGFMVADATQAGTIKGTVRAQGKEGTDQNAADGKYESRKFKFAERVDYSALHDFVVYIDQPLAEKTPPPTKPVQVETRKVSQKSATFSPHVLPVLVGTTVEWPNHDEIFHNVFSISEVKSFDLDLYKGNPPEKKVTFDKPGRVDVFCSIHSTMHCIVLVLENPYFIATDENGHYSITNVPAGTFKLKAWHDRLPSQVKEVTVTDNGEVTLDFTLSITNLPKY